MKTVPPDLLIPDSLSLHIYHLDEGAEADSVIELLEAAGIGNEWSIQRPTEASNAILVPILFEDVSLDEYALRMRRMRRSMDLLKALSKPNLDTIKGFGLSVAMRIHTSEYYLPLPEDFVRECGRLGLEICIFNCRAFSNASSAVTR